MTPAGVVEGVLLYLIAGVALGYLLALEIDKEFGYELNIEASTYFAFFQAPVHPIFWLVWAVIAMGSLGAGHGWMSMGQFSRILYERAQKRGQ